MRRDGPVAGSAPPDVAGMPAIPSGFGTATFLSTSRAGLVNAARADPTTPNGAAWAALLAAHDLDRVPAGPRSNPWEVPGTYTDRTGNAAQITAVRYDSIAAYNFALRYRLAGDQAAAAAAVAQMQPWTALTGFINRSGGNTRLGWAVNFPMMLAACSMIDGSTAYTATFRSAMQALAVRSEKVPGSIGFQATDNQGAWGTLLNLAIAGYVQDQGRYDAAVARWKWLLGYSIDSNGDLWQEIYRQKGRIGNGASGLHYCCHALNAFTYGAEVARANGLWLYDYVTPQTNQAVTDRAGNAFTITGGNTLRAVWERVVAWLNEPDTYPYNSGGSTPVGDEVAGRNIGAMEVLQALWPTSDGASKLAASRPVVDLRGAPYMTLSHAGLSARC